ncbi:MAG: hypothetical protein IT424_14125 [Pirellulales bacterium]|nr:hypothetical protein [Pirellulales bacterium]
MSFESLQPLGVEPDEAAAVRLEGGRIVVAPLVPRNFDACDVYAEGDEAAVVKIELQNGQSPNPQVIEAPLAQLAREQLHKPLDELGSYLLVERAPGDRLRVHIQRDHLVFSPGETLRLEVFADVEGGPSGVAIEAELHAQAGGERLWDAAQPCPDKSSSPLVLEVPAPAAEGAFRLTLTAKRPHGGLAGRLAPWEPATDLARRQIGLVVVDPHRRQPRLVDKWEVVDSVDPTDATGSPWLPKLAHLSLERLPALSNFRPLGNVKPTADPPGFAGYVQLPPKQHVPAAAGDEPAWQAYQLSVRRVGEPHAVEIELPQSERQHLLARIVEPDAAGNVNGGGRACGVYCDRPSTTSGDGGETHRIVFWPRTRSPLLLLANRSATRSAAYGKIRLLRRSASETADAAAVAPAPGAEARGDERLVAAYLGMPAFAEAFGAAEQFDEGSQMSVDTWQTFLDAANRLAQQLQADGYNGAVLSVAAAGGSLTPIAGLGSSPRYDSGPLCASGADPLRKDVLELILRVFDRHGLRLIPAWRLAAPLPALEAVRPADPMASGFVWVGRDGVSWSERHANAVGAPYYNLLNADVQRELLALADKFVARYGKHPAFGGVALQLDGKGYGVLPGLAWGLDDATIDRFQRDAQLSLGASGPDRFERRAALLLGPHRAAWVKWRNDQVSSFYASFAQRLAGERPELKLVLCTEELFAGGTAAEFLRQAVAGRASLDAVLNELGVDVRRLAATPGVVLLRPRRLDAVESIDWVAPDDRVNSAPELDQAFARFPQAGELLYYCSHSGRLPSFDEQSPYGAAKTRLLLNGPSVSSGDASRRWLVSTLAARDFAVLVSGAESWPLADNERYARALRAVRHLPPPSAEVRTDRRQPVTLRIYRDAEATSILLMNESPWPAKVKLPLENETATVWRELGGSDEEPDAASPLEPGKQYWSATLPAYSLAARRYASTNLQVGTLALEVDEAARNDLVQRIAAVEQRLQNLDAERPYNQLQNPQFELTGENGRVPGWQPRVGAAGNVELQELRPDDIAAGSGRALRLTSEDAVGVAIQSQLFPLPATGQLVVRARARTADMAPGARLYAWVDYQSGGLWRQRYVSLGGGGAIGSDWTECEFAIDDLPLGSAGQMRVQFHLAGAGQAWIDDVRLYDLRFPKSQREALAKRLYAAKTALEENQFMDCERLIDGYWPRRLVEYLPPAGLASRPAEAAAPPAVADKAPPGLNGRLRGLVPRILR